MSGPFCYLPTMFSVFHVFQVVFCQMSLAVFKLGFLSIGFQVSVPLSFQAPAPGFKKMTFWYFLALAHIAQWYGNNMETYKDMKTLIEQRTAK